MKSIKVAVTGAAGQISYSLLFKLVSGEVFGHECVVNLRLLELPVAMRVAEGVAMELRDCGFPTLGKIDIFSEAREAFEGVHWALLIGSKPRGKNMERSDLLQANAGIFVEQGKALSRADSDVRVVVVGNPCNTNALIASRNCQEIAAEKFTAMTMLDENRGKSQLAAKLGINVSQVKNLCIWGNHSPTMYPDFENALVAGKATVDRCPRDWLEGEFTQRVKLRGAEIIKARGNSSAASAANACIDHIRKLSTPTPQGEYFSAAVVNARERYSVPAGLVFSFPVSSDGKGGVKIADDLPISAYAHKMLEITTNDLLTEKEMVREFLN